ncbi:Major facilitator, sugar transporter-like, partial [Dillenia turbinata]
MERDGADGEVMRRSLLEKESEEANILSAGGGASLGSSFHVTTVLLAMWLAEIFALTGWLAVAFSKGAWSLDLGRLSMGIATAIISYVVPVYISEISPEKLRGGLTLFNQFLMCCGISTFYFIGNFISWRVLALSGACPAILQLLGLFLIPESPRWLAKVGDYEGCELVLQHLRGKSTDISQEAADIRDYMENLKLQPEEKFLHVFQRKYANALIVGVGLMGLQQMSGGQGVTAYASSIFSAAGFSTEFGTTVLAILQVLTIGLGVFLMDRLGRRPLLLISAAGMCFGSLVVGMSFLFQDLDWWSDATPTLVFFGILIYFGTYAIGVLGIPWVIMSEIFPINIKASAGSLVNLVCWIGSWIVTYTFNFMMEWSTGGMFFVFAGTCGVIVVFVTYLVPETMSRTLEEIHVSMTKSPLEEGFMD